MGNFIGILVFGGLIFLLSLIIIVVKAAIHMRFINSCKKEYEAVFGTKQQNVFALLTERESNYYVSYFIWHTLGKCASVLSVTFSLGGLLIDPGMTYQSQVVSFISVICVVLALYIIPEKRGREYLFAWRKCNNFMLSVLSKAKKLDGFADEILGIENEISLDAE